MKFIKQIVFVSICHKKSDYNYYKGVSISKMIFFSEFNLTPKQEQSNWKHGKNLFQTTLKQLNNLL